MLNNVTFAYPWILYFLLVIPLMALWYWFKGRNSSPSINYSSLNIFKELKPTWRERLKYIPNILRMLAVALLIIALARPQNFQSGENIYSEGIDITMVLDISGSMLAEDLKPNRLEAAKEVIDAFVQARTSDRIGLVIFSREAFTQCPLTIDYSVLRNLLGDIKTGMIEDGTAIGNGIANGVNRLKDSKAKSKVMILLTDGVNNAGEVDPISAAQIAKKFNIRVYTIGVGTRGEAPYPVQTPFGIRYQMVPVEIDENVLKEIAKTTAGEYFRATDNKKLEEIYNTIDKLEKTKLEVTSYRNAKELYYSWLGGGLILLILELGLSRTILRKLP
ncbi:MAG: aerotolerance regulator BatA [Ignavibacteria bacterium GWA2_35_9]|nr:MAG: aerotolerance regulator BatA [Ignavibacteria bacterium GWA2_35_9]OGU43561.1 MAG: aerotolerance regulator BatA [Ignavibacteria bacterium GWB2_36_8]OGU52538.1 MAG: aerotolerance regulator BatA [Ignavibacteria bacterium GWC2_36_12]OGV01721.1 MAG: aerotolerance regulator BatA [Ignavibacteria bacterium RIFOXYB2_FULL_36_7]